MLMLQVFIQRTEIGDEVRRFLCRWRSDLSLYVDLQSTSVGFIRSCGPELSVSTPAEFKVCLQLEQALRVWPVSRLEACRFLCSVLMWASNAADDRHDQALSAHVVGRTVPDCHSSELYVAPGSSREYPGAVGKS